MLCQEERQFLAEESRRFFLHGFARPNVETLVDRVLQNTERQNQRSCAVTARLVVWLVILLSLYREQSIVNVFEQLVSWMGNSGKRLPQRIVTEEAIYHARKRLGVLPMKQLFKALRPEREALPASFYGLRVFGIDGTNFDLPDTPKNSAVFKRHTSQHRPAAFPQVQGLFLTEQSTHRIFDCLFTPCLAGEIAGVPFLLKNLGEGDLLLMDCGLTSFKNMQLCLRREVSFVFRFHSGWKPTVVEVLSEGDYIAKFKPSGKAKDEFGPEPLLLRVLEFRVGENEKVRLVTDLKDPKAFPAIELARLYHQRWECELLFKEIKSQLLVTGRTKTPTHFRSKTPQGILQECWGTVIAHALLRDLMVEGAETCDAPVLSLSFAGAVNAAKIWLPRFQLQKSAPDSLRKELAIDLGRCLIDRPRRPRRFPRVVKSRSGRRQTKKESHRESLLDLTIVFLPRAA